MTTTEQPTPARSPFDEETFQRSQAFANQLLRDIPELESIVIVPSWKKEHPGVPGGMIVGCDGPISGIGAVMRLSQQVYRVLHQLVGKINEIFIQVDAHAKSSHDLQTDLERTIEERVKELDAIEQRLCRARANADPAD